MRWFDIDAALALDRASFGADAWTAEFFWSQLAAEHVLLWTTELEPAAPAPAAASAAGPAAEQGAEPAVPPDGAGLCGFAGLARSGSEAEVLTLAVDPAVRGAGLGRRLLHTMLDAAREAGCDAVYLDVAADNAAARGLYAGTGFVELGRRAGYYQGPAGRVDAVLMRALLSDPAD